MAICTRRFALPRLLISLPLVFAMLALAMASLRDVGAPDHSLTASTSNVMLSDDDSGAAMFDLAGLAPGDQATRCVRVEYAGAGSPAVNLYGQTGGSGLAQHLQMTIEAGQGGGFDSCNGFEGTAIFQGTLADFARAHSSLEEGLPTAVGSSEEHARTFRFHLDLQGGNEAQGQTATASFIWQTDEASEPAAPAQPAPGPADSPPAAAPKATPRPAPSEAAPAAGAPKERPRRHEDEATGSSPAPREVHVDAGGDKGGLLSDIASAAAAVAPRSAFPLLLFLLVLAFLAVQDRIDRRDPKLALAPLSDEPYLSFGGNPGKEGR